MKELLSTIWSIISGGFSINTLKSKVIGYGNNVNLANNDNNVYNSFIVVPSLFEDMSKMHSLCMNKEMDGMLRDVKKGLKGYNFEYLLSFFSNYRAVVLASSQVTGFPGDNERKELLRNLVLDKFKTEEKEGGTYLEAIITMEKLKRRDLRILAVMSYMMSLSRSLRDDSIVLHKDMIRFLLEEVGELKETELENLSVYGLLYPLFPKVFDIVGLERLKDVDEQIYECCEQWIIKNEFVCKFKLTSLGNLLAKNVFSVVYNMDYESAGLDILPLKNANLNVGNIIAEGEVISGARISREI